MKNDYVRNTYLCVTVQSYTSVVIILEADFEEIDLDIQWW